MARLEIRPLSEFDEDPVVQVGSDQWADLLHHLTAQEHDVLSLSTGNNVSKEALIEAVRTCLPLDPPLSSDNNWDGLSDSLWGGIHAMESPRVAIVWSDAYMFSRGNPEAFSIFVEILKEIAVTLAQPRFTDGRPTSLRAFLAASAGAL